MSTAPEPQLGHAPRATSDLDLVRRTVVERARAKGLTLADLSRAMGRNDSYMHQFVHRRSPKRLPEDARAVLATSLGVSEDMLRADSPPGSVVPGVAPATTQRATPHSVQSGSPPDVPVYSDQASIEPNTAEEWAPRPPRLVGAGGVFALWISRPRGRLRAGDLAYVRPTQPPRAGDTVVVLAGNVIAGIGDLVSLDANEAEILDGDALQKFERSGVRFLKVVGVEFA